MAGRPGRRDRLDTREHRAWARDHLRDPSPLFADYAPLELPGTGEHDPASWFEDPDRHAAGVLAVLSEHTSAQPWWLGYLETGVGAETIFSDVPTVTLYSGWRYVLIEAGPEQAGSWREHDLRNRKGRLPDLMFATDRSWLVSTIWDDDWTCVGGSRELVDSFLSHPDLRHRVRQVDPLGRGRDSAGTHSDLIAVAA